MFHERRGDFMLNLYFNLLWTLFIAIFLLFIISAIIFIKKKTPFQKYLFPFTINALELGCAGVFSPMLFNIYSMYSNQHSLLITGILLLLLPTITNVLMYLIYRKKKKFSSSKFSKGGYIAGCFYGCCIAIFGILTTALF